MGGVTIPRLAVRWARRAARTKVRQRWIFQAGIIENPTGGVRRTVVRSSHPRLGFPVARCAPPCSSRHHAYHEPHPYREPYHRQALDPGFCEQVAWDRDACEHAPDNQDCVPDNPAHSIPNTKQHEGDATASTTRIEGSWFISNRTPIPVEPAMSRTRPRSKKAAAAPVATTQPSVATITQSFESQATPPAMRVVPEMAIHHFQGDMEGLPYIKRSWGSRTARSLSPPLRRWPRFVASGPACPSCSSPRRASPLRCG